MALPSSGVLTLDDIQTEFGGTNPIDLSDYYRGGGLVPDSGPNAAIPTSGAISVSDFYGAANSLTLDLAVRAQITGTTSGVAIGTANTNRMVVLQISNAVNNGGTGSKPTSVTIGGVTATLYFPTLQALGYAYAKVPTGTTADITTNVSGLTYQVYTLNTVNSAPTLADSATFTSATPSRASTQNPVSANGVFMWGYTFGLAAINRTISLSTTSAGGVNMVLGANPNGVDGFTGGSRLAYSETANTDSRYVGIQGNAVQYKSNTYYVAVYWDAN